MIFKNLEEMVAFGENADNHSTIQQQVLEMISKTNKCINEDTVKKNCYLIARNVLFQAKIHPEGNELIGILGNGDAHNNNEAVANWIYDDNPNLNSCDHKVKTKYANKLSDILRE